MTFEKKIHEFLATNDLNYRLDESMLIFKANNIPVGIGATIPQKDVSYSMTTKFLLIEGSIFNAAKI